MQDLSGSGGEERSVGAEEGSFGLDGDCGRISRPLWHNHHFSSSAILHLTTVTSQSTPYSATILSSKVKLKLKSAEIPCQTSEGTLCHIMIAAISFCVSCVGCVSHIGHAAFVTPRQGGGLLLLNHMHKYLNKFQCNEAIGADLSNNNKQWRSRPATLSLISLYCAAYSPIPDFSRAEKAASLVGGETTMVVICSIIHSLSNCHAPLFCLFQP